MLATRSRFVLVARTRTTSHPWSGRGGHFWSFDLRDCATADRLRVCDEEPWTRGERLELLAAVRGLEAIDRPADVTLITDSRYVIRGVRFGLEDWRRDGWRWEVHGEMVPVANADLWRRFDHACQIHSVASRWLRWDQAEVGAGAENVMADRAGEIARNDISMSPAGTVPTPHWIRRRIKVRPADGGQSAGAGRIADQVHAASLPAPRLRVHFPEEYAIA